MVTNISFTYFLHKIVPYLASIVNRCNKRKLRIALKELIIFKYILKLAWEKVGLDQNKFDIIHTTVWWDNQGCTILADLEHTHMTPCSKHYALKYHWFCVKLKPNNILIKPIATTDQIGDILLKVYDVSISNYVDSNLLIGSLDVSLGDLMGNWRVLLLLGVLISRSIRLYMISFSVDVLLSRMLEFISYCLFFR